MFARHEMIFLITNNLLNYMFFLKIEAILIRYNYSPYD